MFDLDIRVRLTSTCARCKASVNVAPETCERVLTTTDGTTLFCDLDPPCDRCGGASARVEVEVEVDIGDE